MSKERTSDYKKKRNLIIFTSLTVFLILFTAFQHYILVGSPESTGLKSIFLLVANLNILLLMVVLFLLMRNVIKLYFERRRKVFGSRLKTKLVIFFVTFTIIPTVLLFFYASGMIKRALETWFNPALDLSQTNVAFVQAVDEDYLQRAGYFTSIIQKQIELKSKDDYVFIKHFFDDKIIEYNLNSLRYYSGKKLIVSAISKDFLIESTYEIPKEIFDKLYSGEETFYGDVLYGENNYVVYAIPIFNGSSVLVLNYPLSRKIGEQKIYLRKSIEGYKQMKLTEKENVTIYTVLIGIFSLLIIFSATWFGTYIAKSITIPMSKMAEGIKAVGKGDLSVTVDSGFTDEFSLLSDSFNSMTLELRSSNEEIKRVQENLRKTNIELEARRMYMATVLENITTGVLSVDEKGIITTFNGSLKKMLNTQEKDSNGFFFTDVFENACYKELLDFIKGTHKSQYSGLKNEISLNLGGEIRTLLISVAKMRDQKNKNLGTVFVFEELTQIIKAKKINVWREIAERIAHEIKNPLTPIQLSVQRLIRKFEKSGSIPDQVFMECITNISREVNSLKELVNAFSNFARVPEKNPKPTNINELLKEIVSLYSVNIEKTEINLKPDHSTPDLLVDTELMKQVFKNLINNAIESVDGYKPRIEIITKFNTEANRVRIDVADNGVGIKEENKGKLFVPYFSTKTEGSGLGLAIVNRIIEDHEGYIRVTDNFPHGSIFSIELPCIMREES
jgi:two-component system, NtrC family, nitrogen regulation sensor histidine kinase NtrY